VLDMGGGRVDVLVMDVFPKRNVKKALKELGIEKYCISCDNVTYTIYA
jgi:DNA-directed RNA polymerase subunit N (RpoN/RPB10)